MTQPIVYGGDKFNLPLDSVRATAAGAWAQKRFEYLSPETKPTITLFACNMERELALAYREGYEAQECVYRQLLIRAMGVMATVRRDNTDEWMEYIVQQMNEVLVALGEGVRVEYKMGGRGDIKVVPKA